VFRQHIRVTVRHNYVDPKKYKYKYIMKVHNLSRSFFECRICPINCLKKSLKFKSLVQNKLFFSRNCQVGGEVVGK